jgi:hypothetical protein
MTSSSLVSTCRGRSGRIRTVFAVAAILAMLAIPATALASAFSVKATFPKGNPTAGKAWPISLKVTKGKQKLSGSVKYDFVIPGITSRTRNGHAFKGGVYRDKLKFPKAAVGIKIDLYVIVKTKDGTVKVEHTVTTRS